MELFKKIFLFIFSQLVKKDKRQFLYSRVHGWVLRSMNFQGQNIETSGELNVILFIRKSYQYEKSIKIFDIGANKGEYSDWLVKILGPHAKILAFEPAIETYKQLVFNTKNHSNITVYNFGFSDISGTVKLFSTNIDSGMSSMYQRDLSFLKLKLDKQEDVQVTTIDDFCKKNNIDVIHFLKLDIEGNEFNALKGASSMLDNEKIDFIQFEFGGCNIDSRTYFKDFFNFLNTNYRIYRILKDGLFEIKNYSEDLEIFLTVNYLAQRRKFSLI